MKRTTELVRGLLVGGIYGRISCNEGNSTYNKNDKYRRNRNTSLSGEILSNCLFSTTRASKYIRR